MPFKKVNCRVELEKAIDKDRVMKGHVEEINKQYVFVQALISARKEANLSQTDVANKSGLTQQMVSRVETLLYSPTLNTILRYADAVGVKIILSKE